MVYSFEIQLFPGRTAGSFSVMAMEVDYKACKPCLAPNPAPALIPPLPSTLSSACRGVYSKLCAA